MHFILLVILFNISKTIKLLGHPEVLDINLEVNWTMPEDLRPYRGIFKVFIIPPEDLYLPVIPERINGKLVSYFLILPTIFKRYSIYAIAVQSKAKKILSKNMQ